MMLEFKLLKDTSEELSYKVTYDESGSGIATMNKGDQSFSFEGKHSAMFGVAWMRWFFIHHLLSVKDRADSFVYGVG